MINLKNILNEIEIEDPDDYDYEDFAYIVAEKISEMYHKGYVEEDIKSYYFDLWLVNIINNEDNEILDTLLNNISTVEEYIKHEMFNDPDLDYNNINDVEIEDIEDYCFSSENIQEILLGIYREFVQKYISEIDLENFKKSEFFQNIFDFLIKNINRDKEYKQYVINQDYDGFIDAMDFDYEVKYIFKDYKENLKDLIKYCDFDIYELDYFFAKKLDMPVPSTKINEIKLRKLIQEILKEEEKAYHGTSHYFKCFRTSGIGGGTGMQAYGWGLYFGKEFEIAAGYKGVGSNSGKMQLLFGGKTPEAMSLEYDCPPFIGLPKYADTGEKLIEYAEEMIEFLEECEDYEGKNESLYHWKNFIKIINNLQIETEPMIYVYEVLLHKGKNPSQYDYLDWDSTITQNQVDKINKTAESENYDFRVSTNQNGSNVYNTISNYFEKNNKEERADKQASLFLLKAGIDGNTHTNGSVRIIFDDKAITIVNVCKYKN